jgi:formate dehydrogenase iron-sulfur subunit
MSMQSSLDVVARSATTTPSASVRQGVQVAKLIDESKCIGCKACQVACSQWNELSDDVGTNVGIYDNPLDLTDKSWTLMRFAENDVEGSLEWLIRKDGCMHCADPGCLKSCPAPGAIVKYANGIVDFKQENCIGCGNCVTGCPFDIPRISKTDNKAYKCTLCSDRVSVGLEPACVKTCPTGAITFGSKSDMVAYGNQRAGELVERGYQKAALYNPQGVGGTHVMYVLRHGDRPNAYSDLPANPQISPWVSLWKGAAKPIAVLTMVGAVVAGFFHYMKVGPIEEKDLADGDPSDVPPDGETRVVRDTAGDQPPRPMA